MEEFAAGAILSVIFYIIGVITPFIIYSKTGPRIGFNKFICVNDGYIEVFIANFSRHQVEHLHVSAWVTTSESHDYIEVETDRDYMSQLTYINDHSRSLIWHCRLAVRISDDLAVPQLSIEHEDATLAIRVVGTHTLTGVRKESTHSYSYKNIRNFWDHEKGNYVWERGFLEMLSSTFTTRYEKLKYK